MSRVNIIFGSIMFCIKPHYKLQWQLIAGLICIATICLLKPQHSLQSTWVIKNLSIINKISYRYFVAEIEALFTNWAKRFQFDKKLND